MGDNGTGKSTLLESIAYGLDLPLIGGRIGKASPSFEAAKAIRAGDFSHFIDDADKGREKIAMECGRTCTLPVTECVGTMANIIASPSFSSMIPKIISAFAVR